MRQIVKVQTSFVDKYADALVYNENRDFLQLVPNSEELQKLMAGMFKEFFYADVNGDKVTLIDKAEWQEW